MVSRKASAAKLPSVGLRLNASKPESRLVKQFWDGRFILFRVKLSILYTVFVITYWWVWLFGAIEFKRHDNLDKTSQIYPGIVCVERGHCASIHWGLSNGLTIWLGYSTWAVFSLWEEAAHFALRCCRLGPCPLKRGTPTLPNSAPRFLGRAQNFVQLSGKNFRSRIWLVVWR